MLTVGSLFAGIGGFDLGFERAGFRTIWQVENDGKAQSVLSLRFPNAALYTDVQSANGLTPVDVICGGFPCQDVSVAGKREGLSGERTGLFWQVVRIAREVEPRWMVLENVPGLLSSHGGRDFHAVLVALAECGFRRSYRILDSRYFGVAQRRRRVFLVLRARRCNDGPETVLFESQSSGGDSQAGDEARSDVAATLRGRSHGAGVNAPGRGDEDDENLVTYALGSHSGTADGNQTNRSHSSGGPVGMGISRELAHSLRAGRPGSIAATLQGNSGRNHIEDNYVNALCPVGGGPDDNDAQAGHLIVPERARALTGSMWKGHDDDTDTLIPTLSASLGHHGHSSPRGDGCDPLTAPRNGGVRRLTPLECERLQCFPDGWTCLCGKGHLGSSFCECADSPRYKQLGNAVTVSVAEWIARRIAMVEL